MQKRASMKPSAPRASSPLQHSISVKNAPVAIMGPQHASGNPVSPQPRRAKAVHGKGAAASGTEPPPRSLPDRNISEQTIEDAYVQFIFYCNPYLPPSSDATELRRGFQSMPRTDGRTFSPYVLFELIKKLEAREIETWGNLVLELGVKPPDVSSGQSTQKVQQYAVRLKRWLHAYHIDAFFQYCLGKSNAYFTEIPMVEEANESIVRDGVPPEDDLALRALVPKWRPKRGRRPLDDGSDGSPNAKRQLRATSLNADDQQLGSALPTTSYPQSAFPWDRHSNSSDAWLNATRNLAPRSEQQPKQSREQAASQQRSPPQSQARAHPVPSIEPQLFYMDDDADHEQVPHSAVHTRPPSSALRTTPTPRSAHPWPTAGSRRARKRHTGVSAAWTPDGGSGSKPRGRPPINRSTQDGAYTTFPARESVDETSNISDLVVNLAPSDTFATSQSLTSSVPTDVAAAAATRKPSKLQLQVPQHEGGPVRLATPPRPGAQASGAKHRSRSSIHRTSMPTMARGSSAEFFSRRGDEVSDMSAELDVEDEEEADLERELGSDGSVDWKRRAMILRRKVRELEGELRAVKRRVMEAVMA